MRVPDAMFLVEKSGSIFCDETKNKNLDNIW